MNSETKTLLDKVIEREGGYVDHPADRGGPTKYGITLATYGAYLGRKASAEEVKALDVKTAREIYYTRYYLPARIDALPKEIRGIVFDMCVHHGISRAIRILQRVINQAGVAEETLTEDGVNGVKTHGAAAASQAAMGDYFLNALVDERLTFFRHIVGHNPSQLVFLKGWENRAEGFRVST